jgi:hypothetical protein
MVELFMESGSSREEIFWRRGRGEGGYIERGLEE